MVQTGFAETERHCTKIEGFGKMVQRTMALDIGRFMDGEKWMAQDMKAILMAHTESVEMMHRMEMQTRINMMLVCCEQYQRDCLPYPQTVITNIHYRLPNFAKKKNLALMEVCRLFFTNQ